MSEQPKNGVRLQLQHLSKRYGERQVLHNTQLTIEPGQFVAIVGRSGCGKSTLLRLVAGLESATGGSLQLDAEPVQGIRADTRIMFQDARLLPWHKVIDNVLIGLPKSAREQGEKVLAQVGLADRKNDWPAKLSGGQRQRVALARALIRQPRLILADEPTGSLDSITAGEVMALLRDLNQRLGVTVLMVTHDKDLAARCQRRIEVLDGRVVADTAATA